jgi:RNA polymerase sigma factor (sigma-70 family)
MTAPRDFDALLTHTSWVRGLALQLCADVHAAEDAAQETWAAALQQPPRDPERARGFLARTLRNMLAMTGRSARRRARREQFAALPADAADVDASELVARAELHRQLVAAVLRLPELPRELVLRHYFEGVDAATLARRTGISADAVRAKLRRAREKLRTDLERDTGEGPRAFAMLVAASRPEAGGTVIATTAGAVTIMNLKVFLGAVTAVAVLWLAWPLLEPHGLREATSTPRDPAAGPAAADGTTPRDDALATRTEVRPEPEAATWELPGQLVGIHPEVPWTTSLVVRATENTSSGPKEHDAAIAVTADGSFRVALPSWCRRVEQVALHLRGNDPFYLPTETRVQLAPSDREPPITVPVEPVSVVIGRVVDPHDEPVSGVQVCAFVSPTAAESSGETLTRCATTTDELGRYRLQVPASAPLQLLAVPILDGVLGGAAHHTALLPAHTRVATRWGRVSEVPELRLAAPAFVTGSVVTADGAPVADVEVLWIHDSADGALYDRELGNLMTWADGSTGRIARSKTDGNGRFRLPATPGKKGACYPLDSEGRREPLVTMVTAEPPAEVGFRLAGGVAVVRVLCGGLPVPGVAVTDDSIGDRLTGYDRRRKTDVRGEVRLLRSQSSRQRFTIGRPGNEPFEVEVPAVCSASEPLVVELPPLATAPVSLEFESTHRVGRVEVVWARTDAKVLPIHHQVSRNEGDGPFRMNVPPGRYQVFVRAASSAIAERTDRFLIDSKHTIDVPMHGCEPTLAVAHGGAVLVTMTDHDGRYVRGRATLAGNAGKFTWSLDREPRRSPSVPAGDYELRIHSWDRLVHEARVEVRACEVRDLRVRLP